MSQIQDDGAPSDFLAVEASDSEGHKQALWVGVRPVWFGNDPDTVATVQICYQEEHMKSPLAGPVFLSLETWRELNKTVEARAKRYKPTFRQWRANRRAVRHALRNTKKGWWPF